MATHLRRVPTASLSLQRVGNGAHMASGTSGVWLDFDYTALSPEGRLGAISALCEELSEVNTKLARAQNSLTSLEVEHGNLQWEADGWSSSEDEGDGDGGFAVRTPAPVVAAFNALTVEVLCSTAPAKRMKIVMDELPLALALDPDMQTRFPAHLSRDWARKEQALLSAWLVKTENVRTLQVSNWRANS